MAKKGHSEEQIPRALRKAESGTRVADICREHGISEATYYIWKKKYSGPGLSELRELRQLREENSKLKHLVADWRAPRFPANHKQNPPVCGELLISPRISNSPHTSRNPASRRPASSLRKPRRLIRPGFCSPIVARRQMRRSPRIYVSKGFSISIKGEPLVVQIAARLI